MELTQSATSKLTQGDESGNGQFPAARYFQIHFQHMETQLTETLCRMDELQRQVTELQARLARQEKTANDKAYRPADIGVSIERFWRK